VTVGAETEAHVWCDGPRGGDGCPAMNSEHGPTIKGVREFLAALEDPWVTRRRDGETVDLCPICQEPK